MRESFGSMTGWWRWSYVELRHGFAKNRGGGGRVEVGLHREREIRVSQNNPKPQLYIRGEGGGATLRVPTPKGCGSPHLRQEVAARRGGGLWRTPGGP